MSFPQKTGQPTKERLSLPNHTQPVGKKHNREPVIASLNKQEKPSMENASTVLGRIPREYWSANSAKFKKSKKRTKLLTAFHILSQSRGCVQPSAAY